MRKIQGSEALEVYINKEGYICLKQDGALSQADDVVVMMLPLHVPIVVKWLQEAAAQVEGEPVGIIETEE